MNIRVFNVCLLVGWLMLLAGGVVVHPGWGLAIAGAVLIVGAIAGAYLGGLYDPAAEKKRQAGAQPDSAA